MFNIFPFLIQLMVLLHKNNTTRGIMIWRLKMFFWFLWD